MNLSSYTPSQRLNHIPFYNNGKKILPRNLSKDFENDLIDPEQLHPYLETMLELSNKIIQNENCTKVPLKNGVTWGVFTFTPGNEQLQNIRQIASCWQNIVYESNPDYEYNPFHNDTYSLCELTKDMLSTISKGNSAKYTVHIVSQPNGMIEGICICKNMKKKIKIISLVGNPGTITTGSRGAGTALLKHVCKIAHDNELTSVILEPTETAVEFYKSRGFAPKQSNMKLKTEDMNKTIFDK